jgi:ribosomal protein L7/L12
MLNVGVGRLFCRIGWRQSCRTVSRFATATTPTPEAVSVAKASIPSASVDEVSYSPELTSLVDRISQLNLIQTAQLVSLLKKQLNLPDIIAAPAMAAAPAQTAAAPVEPVVEKTEFSVTLEKFDPASKAKVIREIKSLLPQLNLVEAKAFVESAPKLIKEKVKKDEAEKLKKTLEDLGATITLD